MTNHVKKFVEVYKSIDEDAKQLAKEEKELKEHQKAFDEYVDNICKLHTTKVHKALLELIKDCQDNDNFEIFHDTMDAIVASDEVDEDFKHTIVQCGLAAMDHYDLLDKIGIGKIEIMVL